MLNGSRVLRGACAAAAFIVAAGPSYGQESSTIKISDVSKMILPKQVEIFPPGRPLETAFSGGCGVMEGMASADDGRVFFTEIMISTACSDEAGVPGGRIWVYDPSSNQARVFREPSNMAAGLSIDSKGGLLAAEGADYGGRRVSRTDLATGEYRVLAYLFENRQLNAPNDVTVDKKGRTYFSDIRMFGPENIEQRISGVYRIDPPVAGRKGLRPLTRIVANDARINGVEISPDQKTLYAGLCELGSTALDEQGVPDVPRNGPGGLLAFPLNEDGGAGRPRFLLDLENTGCLDGMAFDRKGNLYAAVNSSPATRGIYVFSPAEQLIARYQLPNNEIALNVTFGTGRDASSLYISTLGIGKIYRLRGESAQ